MKGLAARTFLAVVAAAVPALAVAGILGATLVAVVADVETDFDTAMSTARKVGEVRVLIEKEHGLVARLPAELDLAKVDGYAGEIAAADRKIAALTADLGSNSRVAPPHIVAETDKLRAGIRKATAAIVDATKTFAQSTALDLVKGSFEQDSAVSITLLDAISSNVEAMAAAARAKLKASAYWVWRLVPIAFLIAIAAVGLSLWMIRRQVVAPLGRIGAGMRRLADNDPVVDTSTWPVTGELGQMTRAVERFKETAAARERLQTERNVDLQAAEARSRRTAELAVAFQAEAEAVIASLGTASTALTANANAMMTAAADNETRAREVAESTAKANAAVNSVAAASEEINAAIRSISERIVSAQSIAGDATTEARNACETMGGVVEHCLAIGAVIELIEKIASQTNLLALNATIEAARAGATGRGFAVVATEVKALAGQTARATEQVTAQIHALQNASNDGSHAVDQVAAIIAQLDEIATAIADVMSQQSEATQEISESAHRAATGTTNVLQSIEGMTTASKRTLGISDEVGQAASNLAAQAERLAGTVRIFLNGLRAAA